MFSHLKHRLRQNGLALLASLSALLAALPATAPRALAGPPAPMPKTEDWKPAWLTDLSLRIGESYDSNVYVNNTDESYYPAAWPVGTVGVPGKGSFVTTISPAVGVDLAKIPGVKGLTGGVLTGLTLGYAPDISLYHSAHGEDYAAHRITTGVTGKAGWFSFAVTNAVTIVDGPGEGISYPGGNSSFANGTVRERRRQWQDRLKASAKAELGPLFLRPVLTLRYFDLDTAAFSTAGTEHKGYTNYIDRYEINGGLDAGYTAGKSAAFYLGYRWGFQHQGVTPFGLVDSSNRYQRLLAGFEGKPLPWLKLEAAVGPQFTEYTGNRPAQYGAASLGLIDRYDTDVYAEASATVTLGKADKLALKYTHADWLSSTGVNALTDTGYQAVYTHQISDALEVELGFRAANSNYNPCSLRNDWDYTASVGFKYAICGNLTWDVSYAYDTGRNAQVVGNAVTRTRVDAATREFERSIVSTGLTWAF